MSDERSEKDKLYYALASSNTTQEQHSLLCKNPYNRGIDLLREKGIKRREKELRFYEESAKHHRDKTYAQYLQMQSL